MIARIGKFFLVGESEYRPLAYFFLLYFLIGCGMALGRVTADALFFKRYGIEYLPLMYIVVSAVLCVSSVLYAAFADRLPAERFFRYLLLCLIGLLVCNWLLIVLSDTAFAYPLYFVIYEIASELLLVHAALYLSQNFGTLQVKRLSPIIMAGSQVGVIAGGLFVAGSSHALGVQNILLIWCALLAVSLGLIALWHLRHGTSPHFRPRRKSADQLGQAINEVQQGLRFMRKSDLLRALSFALFFMVITFYVLCYSVNRIYTNAFDSEESLTIFFGLLTAATSIITLLLQLFVTNRVLRRFGARRVNLIFPVTSLFSYIALFASFTVFPALFGSLNKDAVMNAFRNPVRNLFFHALPGNMQGRARASSIIVVLPLALSSGGALLWLMQRMGDPRYFLALGACAALCYLYFSYRVSRAYSAEMLTTLKQKLFIPGSDNRPVTHGDAMFEELARGIRHKDSRITLDFAKMLVSAFPDRAPALIMQRIDDVDNATKDQLIRLMAPGKPLELQDYLRQSLQQSDSHLRATGLKTLVELRAEDLAPWIDTALTEDNPRIQVAGIYAALTTDDTALRDKATSTWEALLKADTPGARIASLELLELLHGRDEVKALQSAYRRIITALLGESSPRLIELALNSLQNWPAQEFPGLDQHIAGIYREATPVLRIACVRQCRLLAVAQREALIAEAMEDSNPQVRSAAANALLETGDQAVERLTAWLTSENRGSPRAQHAMLTALRGTEASHSTMQSIAMAKAADAKQVSQAIKILRNETGAGCAALQLLHHSLEEKLQQIIDLVLLAMQSLEYQEDIDVVRAGITSKDSSHVASALEVLNGMKHKSLARLLCDIIDDTSSSCYQSRKHAPAPFSDVEGVLRWCQRRIDPWLQNCAAQALKSYSH